MIPKKIKAVFEFIIFLHANTKSFKEYVPMVDECLNLGKEMLLLKPDDSFKDKKKYKELEALRKSKEALVNSNVVNVITEKALSLDVFHKGRYGIDFNWGFEEIRELQQQATESDLPTIIKQKSLYLEFRNETTCHFLSFHMFFNDLERYLKSLFSYFDSEAKTEFEKLQNIAFPKQEIDRVKSVNIDEFKYSVDFFLKSEENFEAMLLTNYADKYKPEELNQIFNKFKSKNTEAKRQEAQEIANFKAYLNGGSLYHYKGFKKTMSDSNSNIYYTSLLNKWDEAQKKYIEDYNLKEVSKGLNILFSNYLSRIFTIYKHAFKYRENDSIKDLKQIGLKRARFDCLLNEQTDHFIANLKSEKVKGNYKLLLDRKDYVLGLFTNLESFLKNASINFNKSPFESIFKISKEKINNCISVEDIKFLATLTEKTGISKKLNSKEVPLKSPETFEQLFYNSKHAETCLNVFRELNPQIIDGNNNYIGKGKGIFPLWVKVLKTFKPEPLIKHFADKVYKELLNKKINGLNLTKDASEFRKTYKRIESNNVELDIRAILSQYSLDGKLGK